ncbi:40S ribosomal protein S11, N-terminal [Dillenia turbinata]|uniref:40S ribosomal protein S11, N-terminal n=1 Tax=Dillenia turbinata TaxID=194707 RepID=A0AAN8ZE44_9MAGN
MAEQTEKAFLKQPKGKGRDPKTKSIDSGRALNWAFKTPLEAIEGTCIDKKCPFGTVSIRGRILAATCLSAKMTRTLIVHLHNVKKKKKIPKRDGRDDPT